MNEFMSEEIPYNDIPHDQMLTVKICNGLRPNISEDTPKLIADLIRKCWDAKPENRPTAKELHQIFKAWESECDNNDSRSVIYSQIKECEKIRKNKLKNKSNEYKTKKFMTDHWLNQSNSPSYKSWAGYAFESVCMKHVENIVDKLNIKASSNPLISFDILQHLNDCLIILGSMASQLSLTQLATSK